MPIPLGVLAVAGAGAGPVAAGNAYEHLESQVLGTAVASVSFSNLNSTYGSTYQHLQIRYVVRGASVSSGSGDIRFRLNSDTGSNYAYHDLRASASSISSNAASSTSFIRLGFFPFDGLTANSFAVGVADALDPFETTKNTTLRASSGQHTSAEPFVFTNSGFWNNTAAVTTIEIYPESGNWKIGSRFSLYGLRSS
jgi:hypothetical protein